MDDPRKTPLSALAVALALLAGACASSSPHTYPRADRCGYEIAFNEGLAMARRGAPMDSSAYRARCPAGVRLAEARRGYREGYVLGLEPSAKPLPVAEPRVGFRSAARLHQAGEPTYQPWYTNPAGWTMVGAGLATGIGSVLMHVEFERKLELALCQEPTTACSDFSSRAQLASGAQSDRGIRDVLIGLSVTSVLAGVITFAAWKRPVPNEELSGPQLSLTPTGDGRTSLGLMGRMTF